MGWSSARLALFSLLFCCSSCYSFRGISIPATVNTFYVDQFQLNVGNAPPDLGQQFSEKLRDIVLRSSRLDYNESTPDIEFSGAIREFSVTSVAPQRTDDSFGSALNRLQISVEIEYINNLDDEDTWKQRFSFFQDFASDQVLNDVQDELIETIFDQITLDVFNRAFTNW